MTQLLIIEPKKVKWTE